MCGVLTKYEERSQGKFEHRDTSLILKDVLWKEGKGSPHEGICFICDYMGRAKEKTNLAKCRMAKVRNSYETRFLPRR